MNAPDFLEPCRVLAQKALAGGPTPVEKLIRQAYRTFAGREPNAAELKILQRLHREQLAFYEAHPEHATTLITKSGEAPGDPNLPAPAVAALTMVHRAILSDDDTVMKK
jgi:hypothetical protein